MDKIGDITLQDILEIHKRVIGHVDPTEAGIFRTTQVNMHLASNKTEAYVFDRPRTQMIGHGSCLKVIPGFAAF